MVGNGGPTTGCLIRIVTKYRGYKDACVRLRCQQSPVPSICCSFPYSSPSLSRSLLMQSHITISVYLACISPQLSRHQLSLSVFSSPILSIQPSHVLLTNFFVNSNLHSHFIHSSLISSRNSHDYFYQVVIRKAGPSPVVSLLVPSSQVYPCIRRNTRAVIGDIRISPINPSNLLQAFTPDVVLFVTKAINLVGFLLDKCHFLS